jgi:hypothetical protein
MSTRSDIIVNRADGKWARVYCHFDGYLEGVGQTLFDHYNNLGRAEELVAPGDMSTLAERCDKPPGHSYANKVDGCTVYYGRDRGETNVDAKVADSLKEAWPEKDSWTEFTYVWTDGKWYVADPDEGEPSLIELGDALVGKKTIHPAIKAFGLVLGHR